MTVSLTNWVYYVSRGRSSAIHRCTPTGRHGMSSEEATTPKAESPGAIRVDAAAAEGCDDDSGGCDDEVALVLYHDLRVRVARGKDE